MCVRSVKDEPWRQGPAKLAETRQGALFAAILGQFKNAVLSDTNFDLVAFFQIERVHDRGRQAHCQAVAPFGNLHGTS
jgi:hypothetical protein